MSECVVRMKKYENCLDCDLHQIVYEDSYADTDVYCFKEKRHVGKRFGPIKDLARPDWYPIICQLPEGHGRLVDIRDIEQMEASALDKQNEYFVGWNDAIKICQTAPTIVPIERSET